MPTPVPTNPEPLPALRARYARALEHVYDVAGIRDRGLIRPGEVPANVFDFDDGLRLIISREKLLDGEVTLHVSASFPSECRIADEFRLLLPYQDRKRLLAKWRDSIPDRFAGLAGPETAARLHYLGSSEADIPHWIIPEFDP
jgi:hypothetical protein